MTDPEQTRKDTEAYLARIRKTIADSERLVEAARLRMAETDRMLERHGLTREQVMAIHFTSAQREAVNRELVRLGMPPLEDEPEEPPPPAPPPEPFSAPPPSDGADGELAARQRKFGMMMKPFQI